MKPAFEEIVLTVSGSLPLSTLAKAPFAMALGFGAAGMAGRKRASFRHALLACMFAVLLALPLVSAVAPPIRIAVRLMQARNLPAAAARPGSAGAPVAMRMSGVPPVSRPTARPVSDLLVAAWIAGIVMFLLPIGVGLRQVRRLRRSGLPWQHGQSVVNRLACDAGIRRRIDVLLHEALPGPMTCGSMRPAIVLPVDAPSWDAEDVNRAAVHELEHVKRRDWVIHCAARTVCAMYWFHPLVWMAWRRLELEAERSCDDAVLARSEPTAYADQLVAIAQRLSTAAKSPLLAMASRADLSARVSAVLDSGQRRGRAGASCVAVASAVAAVLVGGVSPLQVVAAPQSAGTEYRAKFRTDTALVLTAATVAYPSGHYVEGLTASDFSLTEDSVPQTITVFEFQKSDGAQPPASYYILGYYPRNAKQDGEFRKIDIVVKTATAAKLEYRPGYYATKRPDSPANVTPDRPAAAARPLPGSMPPVLIFKKDAAYSDEARRAKYQGTVLLDVEIDDSGKVTDIRRVGSLGLRLDDQAIEAVQQWRFKPATQKGKPVSTRTQVEVNFRLL